MSRFDPRSLRNAFGSFMTGVTVVTTRDAGGQPVGFTANSFASVSLDPPLVLVCIANTSSNFAIFASATGFAINVLSEGQKEVSNTFARPVEDRFAEVVWRDGPHGAPVLDGVSAWFDCAMHNRVEAGDHLILIGKVEAFDHAALPGLGYANGAYVTAAAEAEALGGTAQLTVSALIEHNGRVLLVEDGQSGFCLPETRVGKGGASAALARLIDDCGVTAEPGFIYSVYEDEAGDYQHISFHCPSEGGTPTCGTFKHLDPDTLSTIADPAMQTMLSRFAEESRMGNFGVYVGNQTRGQVRPVASKRN
ncbi:flavin reductase family protein [Shimia sp. SDUM112013]|uniref:flavin reductase family protein n=1 Tax=Shimia sp. SDUM112013 TaxID=3136160 RepID=UPI0032EE2137